MPRARFLRYQSPQSISANCSSVSAAAMSSTTSTPSHPILLPMLSITQISGCFLFCFIVPSCVIRAKPHSCPNETVHCHHYHHHPTPPAPCPVDAPAPDRLSS